MSDESNKATPSPRNTPSPGTPGEGRGEGLPKPDSSTSTSTTKSPHPALSHEYAGEGEKLDHTKPRVRYKITVAYRGTRYHGWQRQATPPNWKGPIIPGWGIPTIQQSIERALVHVVKHRVAVIGASRTDSGVHARGQVAHFDTELPQIAPERLRYAINAQLPGDIVITSIVRVPDDFHSIAWAIDKRYEYVVRNHPERNAFDADTSFWRAAPLEVDAMRHAAASFIGTHDFTSFCRPGHKRWTTVRTISNVDVERRDALVVIGFEGNGFLWNQVRIMAGTLIDIGLGIYPPTSIPKMIEARDRRKSGSTAPAHGLYLDWIRHHEKRPENLDEDSVDLQADSSE